MRRASLDRILGEDGRYSANDLTLGLMDWLDVTDLPEFALETLRRLLDRHYPADGRTSGRCRFLDENGGDHIFHAGPVEVAEPLVAWQRRDWIIAMAQRSTESGRIVVGAPAPITLDTARRILSQSILTFMGEPFDSFVGAQSSAGSTGAFYRWDAGVVAPIAWNDGLDHRGTESFGELRGVAVAQPARVSGRARCRLSPMKFDHQ